MSRKKQKLELTWIGKDKRPRLEPRILLEDPEKSYHAKERVTENDIFDNKLIFGDNLLALKALEAEYAGQVKCIYIDPPFNTGNAFEHYEDGLEHSIWLSLMRERFELLWNLLADDGVIFVHLDDCEMAYAKVMMDEVFGRQNYLNTISMTTNAPSGFKATSSKIFSTVNYVIIFAKDRSKASLNKVFIQKDYDTSYNKVLLNRDAPYSEWEYVSIGDQVSKHLGYESSREARKKLGKDRFEKEIAAFAIENAEKVFRTAAIGGGAKAKRQETITKSKNNKGQVFVHPNEDVEGFYILNGEGIVFYEGRLADIDGERLPGEILTDVWSDISWTGIANEGGVQFKNGKKPEKLIKRCLELASNDGDLVLDSFGGSGTTAAVAHKMGRRWIAVELGEQCHTHIIPRMKRIIDGSDQTGISKDVNWKGGGGFRYYRLAPSMLEKDKWGNWVISKDYNAGMLTEAMCKHMGFTYAPDESHYWMHGHSTETDFIYVTTSSLTHEQLRAISEEVGPNRTLLICCKAFNANAEAFDNLTLKKIPQAVLTKCEWGKDDYSLNVAKLQPAESDEQAEPDLFTEESEEA
ncbi:MAG: site-specific DNA-methyltransferase [Alphaproteobacteria bacterium]